MNVGKYHMLHEQYPEYISKIQLYKICGISPKSATYLLQNGIIPSIDTGKATWRYQIRLDDVITYLEQRDKYGNMIPNGAVSSRQNRPNNGKKSYAELVLILGHKKIKEYFSYIYSEYPDVLTREDISEMTGLHTKTILIKLNDGTIPSIADTPKYLVTKQDLICFAASEAFVDCKSNSAAYKKLIGGLAIWNDAKLSQ